MRTTGAEGEGKMLRVTLVATRLGVSRSHVYDLIDAGQLPAYRMGVKKGFRVPADAVATWKALRAVEARIKARRKGKAR